MNDTKTRRPIKKGVHFSDVTDLAAWMVGTYDDPDRDNDTTETMLMDQYDIDMMALEKVVNVLLPMAMAGTSGLTGTAYRAFAIIDDNGDAQAIVKIKTDPENQKNYK